MFFNILKIQKVLNQIFQGIFLYYVYKKEGNYDLLFLSLS